MTVVQTLGPSSYCGFMESVGDGIDAYTHKALVRFHDAPKAVDAYVKVYCVDQAPRGLVNELIGYVLAKHDGLSVPYRAAVLLLEDHQLSAMPAGLNPLRTMDSHIVAWAVQSLGGKSPYQVYNYSRGSCAALAAVRKDFQKWKDLPAAASLDAWLLNEDRNLQNLVRLGTGNYALIDHGRVCTGNGWSVPLERAKMPHKNKLALIAWDDIALENAPKNYHVPIVERMAQHHGTLSHSEPDLDYWLPQLLTSSERDDVDVFLSERTSTVKAYFKASYGVLLP
ncbi:hypothetical protein [Lysobacter soli]|uniref:hypothetical protein n=1 Tax=Lysobacter soli TaxID=453783 RepID=UPI00240F6DBF|nr:hypothetical protein [Lysobacter soli]MDG2517205.1 hypothetical protein [Lysobacter soli]